MESNPLSGSFQQFLELYSFQQAVITNCWFYTTESIQLCLPFSCENLILSAWEHLKELPLAAHEMSSFFFSYKADDSSFWPLVVNNSKDRRYLELLLKLLRHEKEQKGTSSYMMPFMIGGWDLPTPSPTTHTYCINGSEKGFPKWMIFPHAADYTKG